MSMIRRSGYFFALLLAASCGTSSPSSPVEAPGTGASASGSTTTMLADGMPGTGGASTSPAPRRAVPLAGPFEKLEKDAEAEFGGDFAGVDAVDGKPSVFTRDARGLRIFQGARVRVVKHTLVELQAAKAKFDSIADAAIQAGVTLHSAGIDIAGNVLVITFVEPSGHTSSAAFMKQRQIIEERLGPAPVSWRAARSAPMLL